MVMIAIVGGREADPVEYLENCNTRTVERYLIAAFGPGLLKRDGELVGTEALSGNYEFHVTGATAATHPPAPQAAPAVQQAPPASAASVANSTRLLIKLLPQQTKMLSRIADVLETIADKDPYDRIYESNALRVVSRSDYARAYGVPVADLQCMVTGVSPSVLHPAASAAAAAAAPTTSPTAPTPENPVTCIHLVPRRADAHERTSLGYHRDEIDDLRNTLLLCRGIAEAFHRKQLSFLPADHPFACHRYQLHIWVDAIKAEPIYRGASQTIGDYDGAPLVLTVGAALHRPFRRALSFQALRAFTRHGKASGADTELPERDSDYAAYQGSYQQRRRAYAQQLAKDIAADADDKDDEESRW